MPGPADLDRHTVGFSTEELTLINNALNEVCNGVDIEEWEFPARLGATRDEARDLLRRMGTLLDGKSDRSAGTPGL
jgi:hypothetical protein